MCLYDLGAGLPSPVQRL